MDAWYKSFNESVIDVLHNPDWCFLATIGARYVTEVNALATMWVKHVFRTKSKEGLQANARDGYRRHYQTIRDTTPSDGLLEHNLKDGWEPLCKFLDKPVPNMPFSHINDKDSFHETLTIIM